MLYDLAGGQEMEIDTPRGVGQHLLSVTSDLDGPIVSVVAVRGRVRLKIGEGRGQVLDKHAADPHYDRLLVSAGSDSMISVVFLPFSSSSLVPS